jgi:predicted nuclease of restriction endonuclease-like (RecB) superfamily
VNSELIRLYWQIGHEIWRRQQAQGWGTKAITQLSRDLHKEFPEMRGFSQRNLQYMRTFAEAYPDETQFTQQAVAQIPLGHHTIHLDKVPDPVARRWYIQQTVAHGWSRNILEIQIETRLFACTLAPTNGYALGAICVLLPVS